MLSFILASVCVCLAVVNTEAQHPRPCKSPPLLVGRLDVVNLKGELAVFEKFSYDALGRRVRLRAAGTIQNHTFYEDLLMLFREGIIYEISHKNKTCARKALTLPFQPLEIPEDAQFLTQLVIGSSSGPGEGLLVNTWTGKVPEAKGKYISTFTEFGCLPVSSLYHTEQTGWIHSSFFDLVIGIEDPDEFIPPPFCGKAEEVHPGEEMATDYFGALLRKGKE